MESVVYDGPQPSRTLELGPGSVININRGEPFEAPAEVAEQLLEQRHFSAAKKKSAGKKEAKKPTLKQLKAQAAELGVEDAEALRTIKAAEAAIEAKVAEANTAAEEADRAAAIAAAETTDDAGQGGGEEGQD